MESHLTQFQAVSSIKLNYWNIFGFLQQGPSQVIDNNLKESISSKKQNVGEGSRHFHSGFKFLNSPALRSEVRLDKRLLIWFKRKSEYIHAKEPFYSCRNNTKQREGNEQALTQRDCLLSKVESHQFRKIFLLTSSVKFSLIHLFSDQ